jgi:hypothetical protein
LPYLLTYPWEVISVMHDAPSKKVLTDEIDDWAPYVYLNETESYLNASTTEQYPLKRFHQSTGHVIELPTAGLEGDSIEAIVLRSQMGEDLILIYPDRSTDKTQREDEDIYFDQLLNMILFLTRDCLKVEKIHKETQYWNKILQSYHNNDDEDPARYALIVDLARNVLKALDIITQQPKKVLERIHAQQRIDKIQELDTHCFIDLTRRPGRILPEKAGPKQQILAIRRRESINTLENRVAKHFCDLSNKVSKQYLAEHHHINSRNSKRKEIVEKLDKASKRFPQRISFRGIKSPLQPIRQPNYTLMQNINYLKIWTAYIQLVRNDDLRNRLWRWRRRLLNEWHKVFISDTIYLWKKSIKPAVAIEAGEKIVSGNMRNTYGNWLHGGGLPGPFIFGSNKENCGTLHIIDHEALNSFSKDFRSLKDLNADMFLIWISNNDIKVLPIYTVVTTIDWDSEAIGKELGIMTTNLRENLEVFNQSDNCFQIQTVWILHGNWSTQKNKVAQSTSKSGFKTIHTLIKPEFRSWKLLGKHRMQVISEFIGKL